MAIDSREARLRRGSRDLERLGITPKGAAVADLERALEAEPQAALTIVDLLGGLASEASARLLARIESGAREDKALRREARRALYRLKQKGVAVPERQSAEPSPAARASVAGPEAEGYLSISDPAGDRLLWIVKQRSGGGLFHLSVIVNEPAGLKEAVLAEVNRKGIRSLRQELEARHHIRLVEVDWRYCDAIAGEGYERARQAQQVSESAALYPQLRLQLFSSAAEPPPVSPVGAPGAEAEGLASSAALFEEEELRPWFLPEAVLAPYLARYRGLRDSPIVLDRPLQLQRIEEIISTAVEESFSAEHARSWQRRLGEAAHFFASTARAEAARRARAVVAALAESSSGKGIPFCEELVRRSFGLFFTREADREREEKASSVLVTPDDIRAERARAAKSRRTR